MAKTHKTFFGKLFGAIGSIFQKSSQKLWDSLTPEEQASIKNGSGIISVINAHISEAPEVIKAELELAYPALPELEANLLALCTAAHLTPPSTDLTGAITSVQTFLKSKEGTVWAWASSSLAQLLSAIFAPEQTVFAKISTLIEFCYTSFIKK